MNRTIWPHPAGLPAMQIIDQRRLPHELIVLDLSDSESALRAIIDMAVRGAPLIAATAAYGVWLACIEAAAHTNPDTYLAQRIQDFRHSRPTAVNLFHALNALEPILAQAEGMDEKTLAARRYAEQLTEDDVAICRRIGEHGLPLIESVSARKNGEAVHILTHCNAGRLGCIEWGTVTSPIYQAHQKGLKVHVWVDETRPRNQGANLTAWELQQAGVPHTVIVDNTGGHLMQHGMVDLVIVGADRVTCDGDAANKIGTYLKALAAKDNQIPFYVALPSTTIDWNMRDGLRNIPIETRHPDEVRFVEGWDGATRRKILITPGDSPALNYGFDVTPARLITGFITEYGVCAASEAGLKQVVLT